jgi:uncharacterized Ntn-hydrolase superfamily protein
LALEIIVLEDLDRQVKAQDDVRDSVVALWVTDHVGPVAELRRFFLILAIATSC